MTSPEYSVVSAASIDECGARVLYEHGSEVVVADRGDEWTFTAVFVLSLVSGILGINGLVQLLLATTGDDGNLTAGLAISAAAAVTTFALARVLAVRRRNKDKPLEALNVIARFDLDREVLQTGDGAVLAPLSDVVLKRRFQIGSSSRMLVAEYPGGRIVLARGNPFAGAVDGIEEALQTRGISR